MGPRENRLREERELWETAARILADYGDGAGEYVYRATRDAMNDEEARRRWTSIIHKLTALNAPDGALQ